MTAFEQRLRDTLSDTYDIQRELGGGGMSRVFVAIDKSLGRKVVIKLLSPELTADVNRGRFRREIQVAAQLQHPHIVTLLSAGEHEDLVYYTMPFIAGESLRSAVEQKGPLPVEDVVRVLYHVGEALDYAHGEGVVHRDIKPANILRSGSYSLVTDFGVAKALNAAMPSSAMTSTGMAVGTPSYMAPEQLAGDPSADHRIDIYAVGLLAYELLKGKSPFAATTPQKVLAAVLTQDPPPLIEVRPDVPPSFSELVMRCLSKEPDERPATARDLLAALDMFSTASGEIRTMEHRIPRRQRTAHAEVAAATALQPDSATTSGAASPASPLPALSTVDLTAPDHVQAVDSPRPARNGKKMLLGGLAVVVPIAAVAIMLSQRAGDEAAPVTLPPGDSVVAMTDSLAPPPAVAPESVATTKPVVAVPNPDSVKRAAIADSVRRAARAEAAKKAAARTDSVQRLTNASSARRAAAALLADEAARRSFTQGASRRGGPLGTRRRGDLQTQIDALHPFLTNAGLTYEQFKALVAESGVSLFDEFGRMIPEALQRFASGGD
jgi:serine/threonine-protein kinase